MNCTAATESVGVVKIIDMSVVDGPGNRTAIFLQGCDFNCLYCHNPETIDPEGRPDTLKFMTVSEVLDRVDGNRPFIRGITLSGGECMLHQDFVFELAVCAKRRFGQDFSVLLDSNGSVDFARVLPAIDGVMLDLKAADERAHRALTGAPLAPVLSSMMSLATAGKLEELRTVACNDASEALRCVDIAADMLAPVCPLSAIRYKLIKYRPKGVRSEALLSLKVPKAADMEALSKHCIARGFAPVIVI